MLLNLLENILKSEKLKNPINIDDMKINQIIEFLKYFELGTYFTNSHFANSVDFTESDSLNILKVLVELKYLKPVLKFKCLECNHISKEIYNLEEVMDHLSCDECKNEVLDKNNVLKNLILYFMVIKND
ncbi:MAG: hypothetical protein ACRC6U_05400 [Fusobacteriaceae bacterium]